MENSVCPLALFRWSMTFMGAGARTARAGEANIHFNSIQVTCQKIKTACSEQAVFV
jgi:hypothetical protein